MTGNSPTRQRIRFGLPPAGGAAVPGFGLSGAVAGVVLLALVVGGLAWSAVLGRTPASAHPRLFEGSLVLDDTRPLTVIDLATAAITVRLDGVDSEVGASNYQQVQAVPVDGGTFLVNRSTGTFNYLQQDDFVADTRGGGVALGSVPGLAGAEGIASGSDAYIVRSAPQSTVTLVDQSVVEQASRVTSGSVRPLGQGALDGRISLQPGSAAAAGGDLWVLVSGTAGCRVTTLSPDPYSRSGMALDAHGTLPGNCSADALEASSGQVALAEPGSVRLFLAGRRAPLQVRTPWSGAASALVPVSGASGDWWFLSREASGWTVFGVSSAGRASGPYPVPGLGPGSDPAPPAFSSGTLYTLDRAVAGQPEPIAIQTATGKSGPVPGARLYPVVSPTERDSFAGAEVTVAGPRVVFNNPQSLEAVVIFTDGSHRPVVVDKSRAVDVSTTGPADLSAKPATKSKPSAGNSNAPTTAPPPSKAPVPVVQPVSQQLTCANTTQKPYLPQITSTTVSSGSVLVAWSYQLLDQTDCEPDSWVVTVQALTGGHQPANPSLEVQGQTQALVTGLRPATTYSVTVTAYINRQSTSSAPATFTTSPRGPDAPLSVTTTADGAGNWVVSWNPCTETKDPNCVVPADQWTVVGSACGGSYVGAPPSVQVSGDQESVTINSDNLGLLGDSLTFSVYGSLSSGLNGQPTADGTCTQAWQHPNASDISLTAEGQPAAGTITATLQVDVTGDPAQALGVPPSDALFVYSVGGQTVGPTSQSKVTVTGLPAGQQFTPTVTEYPAGHPTASVTVTGAPFSQTLPWPPDLQSLVATGTPDPGDPNAGTVTVTFPADLPSGPLEAVDTNGDSGSAPSIVCGGDTSVAGLAATALSGGRLVLHMGLVDYGGACELRTALIDIARPNPYGGPSGELDASFTIGQPPDYQFDAVMAPPCNQDGACGPLSGGLLGQPHPWAIGVDETGGGATSAGGDWNITAASVGGIPPAADPCYKEVGLPDSPQFPVTFDLPIQCPDGNKVNITLTYKYLGQTEQPLSGPPSGGGAPATTTTSTTSTSTTTTTTLPCVKAGTGSSTSSTTDCGSSPSVPAAALLPANGHQDPQVAEALALGGGALGLVAIASPLRRRRRKDRR